MSIQRHQCDSDASMHYWQKQTSFELKNRKIRKNVTWRLEIKYVCFTSYIIYICSIRLWSSFGSRSNMQVNIFTIPLSESLFRYILHCLHSNICEFETAFVRTPLIECWLNCSTAVLLKCYSSFYFIDG